MKHVQIIDLGWNRIIEELRKADNSFTKVGFPEGKPVGSAIKKKKTKLEGYANMSEVATVGVFNEFGTEQKVTKKQSGFLHHIGLHKQPGDTIKVKPRPFMSTSFDENLQGLDNLKNKLYDKIIKGQSTTHRALKVIGEWMTTKIKKKIRDLKDPPNTPFTIANKKSSNPLIDTGQMINSVTHTEVIR